MLGWGDLDQLGALTLLFQGFPDLGLLLSPAVAGRWAASVKGCGE